MLKRKHPRDATALGIFLSTLKREKRSAWLWEYRERDRQERQKRRRRRRQQQHTQLPKKFIIPPSQVRRVRRRRRRRRQQDQKQRERRGDVEEHLGNTNLPIIANIKISFKLCYYMEKLNLACDQKENVILRKSGNILSIKTPNFAYTVFKAQSSWVNATGLRGFSAIGECLTEFCLLFSAQREDIYNFKVDNITAHGRFSEDGFDFSYLLACPPCGVKSVFYNPQSFPGAILKFECGGCLLLFPSRRYSVVGAKRYGRVLIVRDAVVRAFAERRDY